MTGMDAETGGVLTGTAHLEQSIGDILSTPLGTRVMRRDYGSLLFELMDRPVTRGLTILLFAATALAIRRWEPRVAITQVTATTDPSGLPVALTIVGTSTDGQPVNALVTLTNPLRAAGAA